MIALTMKTMQPGFYWAKWRIADDGTIEGDELTPSNKWEVVEVVENCLDDDSDERLMVSVPGVQRSQSWENFVWGPGPLSPPDGKTGGTTLLATLKSAEDFIAGFEDDPSQRGVAALLANLRAAARRAGAA